MKASESNQTKPKETESSENTFIAIVGGLALGAVAVIGKLASDHDRHNKNDQYMVEHESTYNDSGKKIGSKAKYKR